jgi:hypothetical protein
MRSQATKVRSDGNKIFFQLSLAAVLTAAGVAGSLYWYEKTTPKYDDLSTQIATGYLQDASFEVDRKPATRLLWRPVGKGEAVFGGDTIRTSARGEGQIFLNFGGRVVTLDPDSVIVLEEKQGEVSLDLISGSLFIKNTKSGVAQGDKAPRIRIGNASVSVNSKDAEMSLSIGVNGQPKVAVARGSVEVNTADNKKVSITEGKVGSITTTGLTQEALIETLGPLPDAIVNIGPTGALPIKFDWKPLGGDKLVFLEVGSDKSSLKRIAAAVPGPKGSITAQIPPGVFYWRLSATKAGAAAIQKSIVYKGEALAVGPPNLVEPETDQKFFLTATGVTVNLSWTAPKYLEKLSLFVASDKSFKKLVVSEKISELNSYSKEFKEAGTFYWKVAGRFGNSVVSSRLGSFSIQAKEKVAEVEVPAVAKIEPLPAPVLANVGTRLRARADGSMLLRWQDVEGAEKYAVVVIDMTSNKTWQQESTSNKLLLTKLMPGKYEVKIGTFNKNSELGPFGSSKILEVPKEGLLRAPSVVDIQVK